MSVVDLNKRRRQAGAKSEKPKSWLYGLRQWMLRNGGTGQLSRRPERKKVFTAPLHPPSVMDALKAAELPTIAQDEQIAASWNWAEGAMNAYQSAFVEGVTFLGYAYLSALAQRPEYRVISEVIAYEMTREWIEFKTLSGEDKTEKIKKLDEAQKRFKLPLHFAKIAEYDGFMGRSHLFVELKDSVDDLDELITSIGNGRNDTSRLKVKKDSLVAFRPVEAVWCYPTKYNSNDPLKGDWYKPDTWFVMGKQLHVTRLLTFIGREVPDMLKPAYSFGGLSMSQMAKPYVDNWLRTRQAVSDLVHKFAVSGLKTQLSSVMQEDGDELFDRLAFFTETRDNNGAIVIDKETEDWFNVVTPVGGLEGLQAQSQEHLAAVSRIPLVKLLGIQPAGLNASSEGEIRSFYDWIHAYQEHLFRNHLQSCLDFIQLHEFGEVDPDITFEFKTLWQLDEAGKSGIQKTKADIHEAYISMGAVSDAEVRKAVAEDPDSPYAGLDLDPEALPNPPGMMEGLEGEGEPGEQGGFGEPGSSNPDVPKPRDRTDRFSTTLTNKAENFGGAGTGGYTAHDGSGIKLAYDALRLAYDALSSSVYLSSDHGFRPPAALGNADEDDDSIYGPFAQEVYGWTADEAQWKETDHPRDFDGKFAKVAGTKPSKHLVKVLKEHGYKKQKALTSSGLHHFKHPSGNEIFVGKGTEKQGTYVTGWHDNPYDKPSGVGHESLSKYLKGIYGEPAKSTEPEIKPSGEITKAQLVDKYNLDNQGTITGKDYSYTEYEIPGFNSSVDIFGDGSWSINSMEHNWPSGKGLEDLDKKLTELGAGKKSAQPEVSGTKLKGGFVLPSQVQITDKFEGDYANTYDLSDGLILEVSEIGWNLYKNKKHVVSGTSQESLNAAFEALHPRGEGGKFVAKPGEVKPLGKLTKEQLINKYNLSDQNTATSENYGYTKYGIPNGTVNLYKGNNWEIFIGNEYLKGKGLEDLDKKLTELGVGKKPGEQEIEFKPHPNQDVNDVLLTYGAKYVSDASGGYSSIYEFPNGVILRIIKNSTNPNFGIWKSKTDFESRAHDESFKNGYGAGDLDDALQALNVTEVPANKQPEPPQPKQAIGNTLNFSGMKQIGPQLGSNEGGKYEDDQGNEYYVKKPKSNDHARNEILAAALFGAAGGDTLKYHQVIDGDKMLVGTNWQTLAKDNLSQLSPEERKQAKKDFALHAWLANWDAAGLTGDNLGVTQDGKVIPLDFGGSLLYRAQGSPKGHLFDTTAPEWETLRDPNKNAKAASLYGDMTPEELKESADRLKGITDDHIYDLVMQYGPGSVPEKQSLADKMVARKKAILEKANSAGKSAAPPEDVYPYQNHYHSSDSEYGKLADAAPKPTQKEGAAITTYSGGAYEPWNNALRGSFGTNSGGYPTEELRAYLQKAKLEEPRTVNRRVSNAFAKHLADEASSHQESGEHGKHTFVDHGFASSDHWHGELTIRISLPKGAQAAAIGRYSQHPTEDEILIQAGSKYRVDSYDPKTKTMKATLIRSGPAKGGVFHPETAEKL
jgi:uncharacterized protein